MWAGLEVVLPPNASANLTPVFLAKSMPSSRSRAGLMCGPFDDPLTDAASQQLEFRRHRKGYYPPLANVAFPIQNSVQRADPQVQPRTRAVSVPGSGA